MTAERTITAEQSACCSHLTVKYHTEERPDGGTRGWWMCTDCNHQFWPVGAFAAQAAPAPSTPEPNSVAAISRSYAQIERTKIAAMIRELVPQFRSEIPTSILLYWVADKVEGEAAPPPPTPDTEEK